MSTETETKEAPQPPVEQDLHNSLKSERAQKEEVEAVELIESYTLDEESDDEDYEPSSEDIVSEEQPATDDQSRDELEKGESVDEPPQDLLNRAISLGMTQDEIGDQSPEALEMTVRYLERLPVEDQDSDQHQEDDFDDEGDDSFQIDLDEDLYEPEVIEAIKSLHEHHNKKHARLQSRIDERDQHQRQVEMNAFAMRFDEQVESLGSDYTELFGKGRGMEMKDSDSSYQNRMKLIEQMDVLAEGYVQTGKRVPGEAELFKEALGSVFQKETEKIKTKATRRKAGRRSGQIINRPTQRRGTGVDHPEDEAKDFISQFLSGKDLGDESMLPDDF